MPLIVPMTSSASGSWHNRTFALDDAAFVFQGSWFKTGVSDTSRANTIPSASWTNDTSSNVTFTFPVAAIGFYVYGFPSLQGGRYGICIDCDPQDPTYLPIDGVKNIGDDQEGPVMLFSKTFAGPGIHEIILRNEADPRFNGSSRLSLSGFDLELVNDGTQSSSSSSSPFPLATTTSSSPQTSSTSAMLSGRMGAVIGGAVGGIFVNLILVAAFIFYFRVRRRKRLLASRDSRLGSSQTEYKPSDARRITPFTTYAAVPQSATHLSIPIPTGKSSPYGHRRFASSGSIQDAAGDNVQTPGREQDAGPILLVPREELDVQHTLPPDYEAVFRG